MPNARQIPERICPECRKTHVTKRRQFCSAEHQRAWNNRQKAEGAAIVALVKAWAAGRGGGHTEAHPMSKVAMREMTQIARDLNDRDRAAGRMSALDYVSLLMADGSLHFDRRRK